MVICYYWIQIKIKKSYSIYINIYNTMRVCVIFFYEVAKKGWIAVRNSLSYNIILKCNNVIGILKLWIIKRTTWQSYRSNSVREKFARNKIKRDTKKRKNFPFDFVESSKRNNARLVSFRTLYTHKRWTNNTVFR